MSLFKAIARNDLTSVNNILRDNPGAINDVNRSGLGVLHLAVLHGSIDIVVELLYKGANVDAYHNHLSPLYFAILKSNKALRNNFIDTYKYNTIIEELVDRGAELSGLELAISAQNIWLIRFLIGSGVDVMFKGFFPGYLDYRKINIEICRTLIESGVDINKPVCGDTLARYAIRSGNLEVLKFLVRNGLVLEEDKHRDPHIVEASKKGNIEIVNYLLNLGVYINGYSKYSTNTAISTAISQGNYKLVKLLLERGADKSYAIWTAAKANKNNVKIIDLLLQFGATLQGYHDIKFSAFLSMYRNNVIEVTRALLRCGLRIRSLMTLSTYIYTYNNHKLLKKLLGNIEEFDTYFPLHLASKYNIKYKLTKVLLDANIFVDIPNYRGDTPLFAAVKSRANKNVELLLDYGADINISILNNESRLSRVFNVNDLAVAKILLPHLLLLDSKVKESEVYKQNLRLFDYTEQLQSLRHNCENELAKTKNTYVCNNILVYDFLVNKNIGQLLSVVKNPIVKEKCSKLTFFRHRAKVNIRLLELRSEKTYVVVNSMKADWSLLPEDIRFQILSYLSNQELDNIYNCVIQNVSA